MNQLTTASRMRVAVQLARFSIGVLVALVGCGTAPSTDFSELRSMVLTEEAPTEVASLADAYTDYVEGQSVTVVGRIYSGIGSAFDPALAVFNLIELPKPGHSHDDPGDCPFCKRDLENAATAIVQVVDASGAVLQPSASEIFGLTANTDVIVSGTVSKVGEVLVISVRSMHVLTPTRATEFASLIHG